MIASVQFDLGPIDTRPMSEAGVIMSVRRVDNGAPLVIRDTPVTLTLAGPDGRRYATAQREMVARILKAKEAGETVDEEDTQADMLAALVIAWTGIFTPAGEAIPLTREAAKEVFKAVPVLAQQADDFIRVRANFILPQLRA